MALTTSFPVQSFATIANTSTTNITDGMSYFSLPLLGIAFAVTVVLVALHFLYRWFIGRGVRGAASAVGGGTRRGRGRRRGR